MLAQRAGQVGVARCRDSGQPSCPLSLAADLGPGEVEVLALALEHPGSILVIDDLAARRAARVLRLRLTGTLGLLIDAKRAGLIAAVAPFLDQLQALRFRLASHTRASVLKLSGRQKSNLPRTLKTMEHYGLVTLKQGPV